MSPTLSTDIAVIGAGTAGIVAFNEIRRAGASALLIDHGPLGTTCARVGCMPSKVALHAGRQWAGLRSLLAGGEPPPAGAATPNGLWRHARITRDALAQGAAERTLAAAGDRLRMGTARFVDAHTIDIDGQRIRARAFVVATGSRPVMPRGLAPLGDRVLTTDTLFELDTLPASIGVLGLGGVGLEMGLALARLGVRVVAGDLKHVPAAIVDPVIGERAVQCFGREMTMWLGQPVDVQATDGGLELRSGAHHATVERVLAALGRRPKLELLDLARAGVALDGQGLPVLDPHTLRAGDAAVFLAGDVSPDRPLMHEAADEGVIAARAALRLIDGGAADLPARRTPLSIVFSDPDIAMVGAPFDRLDAARIVVGSAQGGGNGRSRIMGAEENLVRVYVDRERRTVLGGSLIASHGEHLAHLLAWAVQRGETVDGLLELPYYHPSIEEMLQSALKDAQRALDAP